MMIGLDTNVLLRYLVQDDAVQSPLADRVIDQLSRDEQGFVSLVALTEVAWILGRSYRLQKDAILHIVDGLLASDVLRVEKADVVASAARSARTGSADFADALIGGLGSSSGCTTTLTFDRVTADLPTMTLVAP